MKRRVGGLTSIWIVAVLSLWLSGSLLMFWDFISFLFVPGMVIAGLYARFGNQVLEFQNVRKRNEILSASIPMAIVTAFFGVVSGLVITFATIEDWSKINSALSVCLIPGVYASLMILTAHALRGDERDHLELVGKNSKTMVDSNNIKAI